jgi:cellobiose phosphorylase
MYRLVVESLLGLRIVGNKLHVVPCIRVDWQTYKMHYRYRETVYHITVSNTQAGNGESGAAVKMTLDGVTQTESVISLVDDHFEHQVDVTVGTK